MALIEIAKFAPAQRSSQSALYLIPTGPIQRAGTPGKRCFRDCPQIIAIGNAFRGQSFGGPESDFNGYVPDGGSDLRDYELVEVLVGAVACEE